MSLRIVESTKEHGNMNANKRFYPELMTKEEREQAFFEHRSKLGKQYGFDPNKFFMADQLDKCGTYFNITEEYVRDNPKGWSDIRQDILMITDKVPGVVIGHPVADCPVVIMADVKNGFTAIGHCGAEMIDKKLPIMIADALVDACDSRDDDLFVYVSACAGSNWTYNNFPRWATDLEVWKNSIVDENGIFRIDLRKALMEQFKERNIKVENITFNKRDTITDERYYSNFASSPNGLNDVSKAGRHFAGAFYEEPLQLVKKVNL